MSTRKIGAPLYCGRACAGLARRRNQAEKIAAKAAYDKERRAKLRDRIKAEKAAYYQRTKDPIKEAAQRKARMHLHVAYCQRPEYRAWKSEYDRQYRAHRQFGEYAEAFMLLLDIENEVASQASRYEIYKANGTLNKSLQRRRSIW